MALRERAPRRLRLTPRFLIATALLVLTAVTASLWTLGALSRMRTAADQTLRLNDEATRATAQVSTALEREDDALLLVLAGDVAARVTLTASRDTVDESLRHLDELLDERSAQELVDRLKEQVDAYRRASDRVAQEVPGSLLRYHREVNPLLRVAVGYVARLRDRHFEASQAVASEARAEVARARGVVLGISLVALVVSVLLALHLARLVIVPLAEMTRSARAIARGDFEERLAVRSHDELGDLAEAFNEMAERLAEFRRMNLDEVLRAQRALEATVQALPDAVVLVDAERRILSLNRRARDVLTWDGDATALESSMEVLRVGDTRLADLFEPGEALVAKPMDLASALHVTVDGAVHRLLARSMPVDELGDGRPGAIVVLYDVTELARLDAMRAELVAVASHELRTPLTTLRMSLLMLGELGPSLRPRERELITTCLVGVEQLGDTIDEFLDLARIEAGKVRLNVEAVEVRAFLERMAERWRTHAHAQGLTLSVDAAPNIVRADASRLRVVLDNLLSNAMKYAPSGGTIRMESRTRAGGAEGRVELAVVDGGPGVPVAYRARVFEKFFRVEHHLPESEAGDTHGVGIGLYLCRELVSLHGGSIRCEDAGGGGARFVFDLPRCAEGEES